MNTGVVARKSKYAYGRKGKYAYGHKGKYAHGRKGYGKKGVKSTFSGTLRGFGPNTGLGSLRGNLKNGLSGTFTSFGSGLRNLGGNSNGFIRNAGLANVQGGLSGTVNAFGANTGLGCIEQQPRSR